jgi:hypothetical protein
MSEAQKRYREKNIARLRIQKRNYYLKNRETILLQARERYRHRTEILKKYMPERVNKIGTFAGTHENSKRNLKRGR